MDRATLIYKLSNIVEKYNIPYKELLNMIEFCTEHIMQTLVQSVEDVVKDLQAELEEQLEEE